MQHLPSAPAPGRCKDQGAGRSAQVHGWEGPILTDSGGFQVFSLAQLRTISELGVRFQSHIDGRRIFMGPEESMRIQSNLASTIAMAFDECPPSHAEFSYIRILWTGRAGGWNGVRGRWQG